MGARALADGGLGVAGVKLRPDALEHERPAKDDSGEQRQAEAKANASVDFARGVVGEFANQTDHPQPEPDRGKQRGEDLDLGQNGVCDSLPAPRGSRQVGVALGGVHGGRHEVGRV